MFGAAESISAFMITVTARDGDVFVITSLWRRCLGKERWVIARRPVGNNHARFYDLLTDVRLEAKLTHALKRVGDPDQWPDDVCVAVAKIKLSQ